jgi:hypothetical protein
MVLDYITERRDLTFPWAHYSAQLANITDHITAEEVMPGDLSVSQLMVSVDYPGTVGDHLVLIDFEEFGTFDPNSHLACLREGQFDVLRFQFNTEWISSRVRTEELGLTLELGKAMLTKLNAMMQHTLDVLDLAALMGRQGEANYLPAANSEVAWCKPSHVYFRPLQFENEFGTYQPHHMKLQALLKQWIRGAAKQLTIGVLQGSTSRLLDGSCAEQYLSSVFVTGSQKETSETNSPSVGLSGGTGEQKMQVEVLDSSAQSTSTSHNLMVVQHVVGGSTGAKHDWLEKFLKSVSQQTSAPPIVVIFMSNSTTSSWPDATWSADDRHQLEVAQKVKSQGLLDISIVGIWFPFAAGGSGTGKCSGDHAAVVANVLDFYFTAQVLSVADVARTTTALNTAAAANETCSQTCMESCNSGSSNGAAMVPGVYYIKPQAAFRAHKAVCSCTSFHGVSSSPGQCSFHEASSL